MQSQTYFSCTADITVDVCVCVFLSYFFSPFFCPLCRSLSGCESLFLNEYIKIYHTTQDYRLNAIDSCFVLFQLVTPTMKALSVRWVRPMWCSHTQCARDFFKTTQRNIWTQQEWNYPRTMRDDTNEFDSMIFWCRRIPARISYISKCLSHVSIKFRTFLLFYIFIECFALMLHLQLFICAYLTRVRVINK